MNVDFESQLREKENDVQSLEKEKAAWLSRGVQAEFEKKEEVWQHYYCNLHYIALY